MASSKSVWKWRVISAEKSSHKGGDDGIPMHDEYSHFVPETISEVYSQRGSKNSF